MTAADLAKQVADTARAIRTNTAGWSHYLPPIDAVQGVQRLTTELVRSLAALATQKGALSDELED